MVEYSVIEPYAALLNHIFGTIKGHKNESHKMPFKDIILINVSQFHFFSLHHNSMPVVSTYTAYST